MAEVTGIIGTTTAAPTARAATPAVSTQTTQTESFTTPQITPLSPAMHFDPVAGVMITEFLNSSGEINTQIPSTAAVAYLRLGLTSDGLQPEQPKTAKSAQTEKTV